MMSEAGVFIVFTTSSKLSCTLFSFCLSDQLAVKVKMSTLNHSCNETGFNLTMECCLIIIPHLCQNTYVSPDDNNNA